MPRRIRSDGARGRGRDAVHHVVRALAHPRVHPAASAALAVRGRRSPRTRRAGGQPGAFRLGARDPGRHARAVHHRHRHRLHTGSGGGPPREPRPAAHGGRRHPRAARARTAHGGRDLRDTGARRSDPEPGAEHPGRRGARGRVAAAGAWPAGRDESAIPGHRSHRGHAVGGEHRGVHPGQAGDHPRARLERRARRAPRRRHRHHDPQLRRARPGPDGLPAARFQQADRPRDGADAREEA